MFKKYNPNPYHQRTGDCVIRAISKALCQTWDKTYVELAIEGYLMGAMPSENEVWGRSYRMNRYDDGHSYGRRYYDDRSYDDYYDRGRSRDDGMHKMTEELEEMLENTNDADVKDAIKKTMAHIKKNK